MKISLIIFFLITCIPCARAQPPTQEVYPGNIGGASFVYHPQYKSLALIGGSAPIADSTKSNVWIWNGTKWSVIAASGPGSRTFFPCATDVSKRSIFGFAGHNFKGQPTGDLWRFAEDKWERVASDYPGTRDHHNMVYADHLKALVIYGGQFSDRTLDTATWLVRDGKFTPLTIPGPGKRYHEGLVYDKHRKKVILYGGGEKPEEHWEFDGERWEMVRTPVNPGKRLYHFMVYDEKRRRTILHGGWSNQNPRDSMNHRTPLTWAFDGKEWKKIAEQPVFALAMGYHPVTGKVTAYGKKDLSKTPDMALWELEDSGWVLKASFGKWNTFEYVRSAVQNNPDDMQALRKYADMLQWETKDWTEAEVAYRKLVETYPSERPLLIDMALVLSALGKLDGAKTHLDAAEQIKPLERREYVRLAGLLSMDGKTGESIGYLEKAVSMQAGGEEYFKLACAYAHVGKTDKAFEHLNAAVDNGFKSRATFVEAKELVKIKGDPQWNDLLGRLSGL